MLGFIQNILLAVLIAASALLIAGMINRGLRSLAKRGRLPHFLEVLFQNVLRWTIIVVAILLVLSIFDTGLGGVWNFMSAMLAAGSLALIAGWSILSNLLANMLILIVRPFNIGDRVEIVGEDAKGKVREVGAMYTTLEDPDGNIIQVPNNIFFQRVVRRLKIANGAPPQISTEHPVQRD